MNMTTQFAMVEELANLVKENLRSKHMVLSMEQLFLNFLTNLDSNSDGVLELEPMDPYNRLLLHRLADIFGFAHVSVGEGENRHLILERCPETSVPSILVSDILFQYDDPQSLQNPHQLLRRNDSPPVLNTKVSSPGTIEERKAAYLAARKRIISLGAGEMTESTLQKPRSVPVVARRMIAHALGRKATPCNQDAVGRDCTGLEEKHYQLNIKEADKKNGETSMEDNLNGTSPAVRSIDMFNEIQKSSNEGSPPSHLAENSSADMGISSPQSGTARVGRNKIYSKDEHLGAAKRMFTHALGLPSVRGNCISRCKEINQPRRTER